jgi:GTP-binding protein
VKKIKNIAIIAHVDHGKTTLVDAMLKQAGVFRDNQHIEERVMDSNALERERGITIFSKNASLTYEGYKINFVDTPGHADFGGEVQRILKMADSVLLLVDAVEGPMPQTKYVLKKSLKEGHRPIVVINKIDRTNARPHEVLNMVFDLFIELGASDYQLDFPVIFASAKKGYARQKVEDVNLDLKPLFESIIKYVEDARGDEQMPFQFLTSAIEYDNYLGKMGTGRIHNGRIRRGDEVVLIKRSGGLIISRLSKIFAYAGLGRIDIEEAFAGDIVTLAGMESIDVGDTVADRDNPVALPSIIIDEPTLAMTFIVNDSPFAGREGKYLTARHIWDRLQRELQTNVSIKVEQTDSSDSFIVKGRGELQLSILIENMRREGYEFQVSKPEVIFHEKNGIRLEPIEHAIIDVAAEYAGIVIEKIGMRKGGMTNMLQGSDGYTRLEFMVPSRGLIGFRSEFLTETRGTGMLYHSFKGYEEFRGEIPGRNHGVLVAFEDGVSVSFALDNIQERGMLFIGPGVSVYEGMIVGEHHREGDIVVNVCKVKKLTNMRASGSEEAIRLIAPKTFNIEESLEYLERDELLEVTPQNIRMRKKILDRHERKKSNRVA